MKITKEMLEEAAQAANYQQLCVMYVALKKERDALSAQVCGLTDELDKSANAILERVPSDEIHSIACSMLETVKATPQQHLSKFRSETVKDFIMFMYSQDNCQLCNSSLDIASNYAENISAWIGD